MIVKKLKKTAMTMAVAAAAAMTLALGALAAELPETLVPVGEAVGISIKTRGVVVSELSEFESGGEKISPALDAGILPGDVITMVNGREITSAADMLEVLDSAGGETVTVQIERSGERRQVSVTPYFDGESSYLGVWVRDGLTGIGTVTYYDPETGSYGALGHSVADSATGLIVPLREGEIMAAEVTGITPSRVGEPGQLGGLFDYSQVLGSIVKNCQVGIFGVVTDHFSCEGEIAVAAKSEIRTGSATILSDVTGEIREYSIEITRLYDRADDGRDMMIKVTDAELLALTGGIVQGMSGSPIIQNGKLVGAVTHVLINDPAKGYGVSIETMVNAE